MLPGMMISPGFFSGGAPAAPVYRAVSARGDASGNSLALDKPSGTAEGDTLVAVIRGYPTDSESNYRWALAGWTEVIAGRDDLLQVLVRTAGASEGSNYTFATNGAANGRSSGVILRYSGVSSVVPASPVSPSTGSGGTSATASAITTTVAPALLLMAAGSYGSGADGMSWTPPGGMTERVDTSWSNGAQSVSLHVADAEIAAAGSTGTRTAANSGSQSGFTWAAALVALQP